MDFSENALDTAGDNDKSENHENVILGMKLNLECKWVLMKKHIISIMSML